MSRWFYTIEDERTLYLPEHHDRETLLMSVGNHPPDRDDLEGFRDRRAQVWRYHQGTRVHVGAVDELPQAERARVVEYRHPVHQASHHD